MPATLDRLINGLDPGSARDVGIALGDMFRIQPYAAVTGPPSDAEWPIGVVDTITLGGKPEPITAERIVRSCRDEPEERENGFKQPGGGPPARRFILVDDAKDPFRGVPIFSSDTKGIVVALVHTIKLMKMKQAHLGEVDHQALGKHVRKDDWRGSLSRYSQVATKGDVVVGAGQIVETETLAFGDLHKRFALGRSVHQGRADDGWRLERCREFLRGGPEEAGAEQKQNTTKDVYQSLRCYRKGLR